MIQSNGEYYDEIQRIAGAADPCAALAASPLAGIEYGAAIRHSPSIGLWADLLVSDDGHPSDADAWDAYGPAVAYYAAWWDAYVQARRRPMR